jgi:hypothetical protein
LVGLRLECGVARKTIAINRSGREDLPNFISPGLRRQLVAGAKDMAKGRFALLTLNSASRRKRQTRGEHKVEDLS